MFELKEILKAIDWFEQAYPVVKENNFGRELDEEELLLAQPYFKLKAIAEEAMAQLPGKEFAIIKIK